MELMFGVMGACRNDSGSEELISEIIQLPACLLACLLACSIDPKTYSGPQNPSNHAPRLGHPRRGAGAAEALR